MTIPIRVLILEDRPDDAELMLRELRRANFDVTSERVETEKEFLAQLETHPDIILADYTLPEFDGISALHILRKRNTNIPFILVSGSIGEELAVTAIKEGAADYLLKDRLARLGSVVVRVLENQRLLNEKRRADEQLRKSEEQFRAAFEQAAVGMAQVAPDGRWLRVNQRLCDIVGYAREELLTKSFQDITHSDDVEKDVANLSRMIANEIRTYVREKRYIRKDGVNVWVNITTTLVREPSGAPQYFVSIIEDITERMRAEEALRESEEKYRMLTENIDEHIYRADPQSFVATYVNKAVERIYGYTVDEWLNAPSLWKNAIFPEDRERVSTIIAEAQKAGHSGSVEYRIVNKQGQTKWVVDRFSSQKDIEGKLVSFNGVVSDITDSKQAQEKMQRQLEHLTALSAIDRVIAANFDLKLSLSEILNHVTKELGVDAADIFILNSSSQILEFGAERGFRTRAIRKGEVRLGESFAGRAALDRKIIQIPNLSSELDNLFVTTLLTGEDFVCYYGVPLIAKGQVKGVLEVFHRSALAPDTEWFDFLNTLAGQAALAIENSTLFESLQRSNVELSLAYDATIEGWSRALDLRDKETEGHTQRVTEMTAKLARAFGLNKAELVQVRWGSLLHDIGKMGVPDEILHKPGPLTDEEWVVMKKHPSFAYEMLSPIRYLRLALDIPYGHHEKWDGSGYPHGLKGEQIPLVARIFAVVDVWDALSSDRPYRPAWTEEKVREYILAGSGTHFDPKVVDLFMQIPK
ncbi:MAG: PAS domain S-box protein [Chloroflexi bacterium]|nr:PAS domain S-box protein [Chloroflexota bacterium]